MQNLEIVLDIDFPDPSVMRASNGKYYAYATQRSAAEKIYNVQLAESDNLKDWRFVGDALPSKPEWASTTQDFWAPHVLEDGGRFYLYYSALPNDRQGMAIGVAISDNPLGPFTDKGSPLIYGHWLVNIDPFAFYDPQTGKKLLYWGSGFEAIKARELADNWLDFKKDSPLFEILHPSWEIPHENLIEGAFIRYRPEQGYYFLFTSGDDFSDRYAILISRSKNALGPYKKLSEEVDREDNILIKGNDYLEHPGNNSIVTDEEEQDWLFCHVIDPKLRRDLVTGALRRPMARAKIHYENGWPHIEGWSTHHLDKTRLIK
jgi:arabinan endo-1,5-alpha-L-arabinosidase